MLVVLFILTILYGFTIKSNGKFFWVWCVFLLCILMSSSQSYADLAGYERYYSYLLNGGETYNYLGYTAGWYLICKLSIALHLTYRGMLVLVVGFSCTVMHLAVKKVVCDEKVFWGLFLIFPALVQCVQVRFFMATAIVFYGFVNFLLNEKSEWAKYIATVIIACFIHVSCIVFLVLIFTSFFKSRSIHKAICFSALGTAVLYYGLAYIPIIAESFLSEVKYKRYFASQISVTTFSWVAKICIVWAASVALILLVTHSNKQLVIESKDDIKVRGKALSKITIASILLVITLPLLAFDSNFHRFIEIGYEFVYLIIARFMMINKNRTEKLIVLCLSMIVLVFAAYIYIPYGTIIRPFFTFDGIVPLFY